ncbi:LysR family transcriptional regulator [Streptomyces sp. b94]|uniref:LysR family transcriptional regulator n=1 Tax=Streptomyces sp. b94 TaxID=1827634 RepID=UPI001B380444|nr:LysR family transcriptional regulator [Streptomyces sp. b94]MBQ1097979.1 LysR family transcriptional regulator [Streptomyces sp. b94]
MRHLRIFVAVAEELHFSRAADQLGMAQPPLSQAVRRLEKELGAELFDRSRRQVKLTPAGTALLDEARALLTGEKRLRTLARRAEDGELGTLRAGIPPGTTVATLSLLLGACAEQHPGMSVDFQEIATDEQLRLIASGGLDVGLVHQPVDVTGLRLGPEVSVELGAVLPRLSPLARLPEVPIAELSGHDLVLLPRKQAPGWYDRILDTCRAGGYVPTGLRHASRPELVLALVSAGHGIAFDQGTVAGKEPRVVWLPLAGHPLIQRTSAVWPARGSSHPAAPHFAELAADVLARDRTATPLRDDRAPAETEPPRPWAVVYDEAAWHR